MVLRIGASWCVAVIHGASSSDWCWLVLACVGACWRKQVSNRISAHFSRFRWSWHVLTRHDTNIHQPGSTWPFLKFLKHVLIKTYQNNCFFVVFLFLKQRSEHFWNNTIQNNSKHMVNDYFSCCLFSRVEVPEYWFSLERACHRKGFTARVGGAWVQEIKKWSTSKESQYFYIFFIIFFNKCLRCILKSSCQTSCYILFASTVDFKCLSVWDWTIATSVMCLIF